VHAVAGPVSTGFQAPTPLSVVGETASTSLAQCLRSLSPSPLGLSESVPAGDDSINEESRNGVRLPKTADEDSGGSGSGGESQPDDDDEKEEEEEEKEEEQAVYDTAAALTRLQAIKAEEGRQQDERRVAFWDLACLSCSFQQRHRVSGPHSCLHAALRDRAAALRGSIQFDKYCTLAATARSQPGSIGGRPIDAAARDWSIRRVWWLWA
jgi:hypothetical protein